MRLSDEQPLLESLQTSGLVTSQHKSQFQKSLENLEETLLELNPKDAKDLFDGDDHLLKATLSSINEVKKLHGLA